MRAIRVEVPGSAYDVLVGSGIMSCAGERLLAHAEPARIALVTDDNIAGRFGVEVDIALARAGFSVAPFTIPAGEASKNWEIAGHLLEGFAEAGLDRRSVVVALGGGVVGDLAGFVASVYLRGVMFYQVPTTLLAMVDSSVGGKTAVDLRAGKNLAGAFKQPMGVLADIDCLATLPEGEWRSGLAEVVKTAMLDGEEFFAWIEDHSTELSSREPRIVEEAVTRCVAFKAAVVARDEQEEGPRECLNLGHTFGHALEKVLGYGHVTHGAAVAEGLRFCTRVGVESVATSRDYVKRVDRLLDALGLVALPEAAGPPALLAAMRSDKKARSGAIRFVLPLEPGVWRVEPVADETIEAHLRAWASTKGEA